MLPILRECCVQCRRKKPSQSIMQWKNYKGPIDRIAIHSRHRLEKMATTTTNNDNNNSWQATLPPPAVSTDIWSHPSAHWLLRHEAECNPVYLYTSHQHFETQAASQPLKNLKVDLSMNSKYLQTEWTPQHNILFQLPVSTLQNCLSEWPLVIVISYLLVTSHKKLFFRAGEYIYATF